MSVYDKWKKQSSGPNIQVVEQSIDDLLEDNLKPLDKQCPKPQETVTFGKDDMVFVNEKMQSIVTYLYDLHCPKNKMDGHKIVEEHNWQLVVQEKESQSNIYKQNYVRNIDGKLETDDAPKDSHIKVIFDSYFDYNICNQTEVTQDDAHLFRLECSGTDLFWNKVATKHMDMLLKQQQK